MKILGDLVLVVVVDSVVPEQGLVTVSPLKVLGADVLVGVFDALLQRRHMAPVFPVVLPQNPSVDAGCNQEDGDTVDRDLPPQLGGGLGVVLDMLSLLDELVFGRGAGETALRGGTQLRGEARSSSGDGS